MPICLSDRLHFTPFSMHDNDQRQRCRRECSPPPPRTKPEITSGENKASKERERASHKSCQATQSAVRRRHRVLRVANRKNKASNLPTQERNTKLWSQESDVGSKNPSHTRHIFRGIVPKTGAISAPSPVHPHKMTMEGGGWAKCPRSVVQQMPSVEKHPIKGRR